MNKDVIIETERLILRQWNMNDIDDIVEGLNNINVTKWLAGAPFPYGKDPKDSVIRIAPSFPTMDDLKMAAEIFVVCVKLASVEKLLEAK